MYGCSKDCLTLIPFRLPQISCFTLGLKCFSSDSQLPPCGDRTPASVPPSTEGRSSPTHTPVFFLLVPFSYRVLCGSIYCFPLVRYSCPLSTGVLHALVSEGAFLMYPWREMYSSPPTPPPSCSPPIFNIKCFECVINCGCFYNSLLKLFIQVNSQIRVKFFLFLFLLSSGQVYNILSTTWVSV